MITGPGFVLETRMRLAMYNATLITGVYSYPYNSVIGLDARGRHLGRYDKMQLVPFGEFVPYRDFFKKIPGLGPWLDKAVFDSDAGRGRRIHLFDTGRGKAGVMICFESMVPWIARRMTRDGADMLIVVTNDAWFQNSPAAAQHVALARLRAIENRRYLAQSANGLTTVTSGLFTRETVNGVMYPRRGLSFYTRHGDLFGVLCLVALAAIVISVSAGQWRERRRHHIKK